jgi:hypothetical protein
MRQQVWVYPDCRTVDIGRCQRECFGDAQPGCGQQPEDTPARGRSQAMCWRQSIGRIEQCAQFDLGVDVRDEAPVCRTKETSRRNLRRRIGAQAKACEAAQNLDAARPGERAWALRSPCPCYGKRHRQVIFGATLVGEAGKRSKLRGIDAEFESVTAAMRQVRFDPGHPGNGGIHGWLPDHGRATARKPSRSTRA